MKNKSFMGFLLNITDKLKPVLTKIFPIEWLRKVKIRLVKRSINKIKTFDAGKFDRTANNDGVNLIGDIKMEIGLGQSNRFMADALQASEYPFTVFHYEQVGLLRSQDETWAHAISNTTPYNINLIHINPHELSIAFSQLDKSIWKNRYNIGFWMWELEIFPEDWMPALNLVDEIWSASDFSTYGLRQITNKPVTTIPYALSVPTDPKFDRNYFNLPEDKFLYLAMYDSNSTLGRKNPVGAINAYKKAFPIENPNCGLVLKANNPQQEDLDLLSKHIEGYKNIFIIPETLSKVEVNSLFEISDVYISLHRSEGFGLPPAEAMWVGTPIISTNWSATTEFMTPDTACLVDFDFITIENDIGPYKAGNRWADPHIDQAAEYMLKLYNDQVFYNTMSSKAQKHVQKLLSLEQAASKINNRIRDIYKENPTT